MRMLLCHRHVIPLSLARRAQLMETRHGSADGKAGIASMKRSRRVWLKLMGNIAIGAASIGLTTSHARSHHHHAGHDAKRKPAERSPSGGFGGAPRTIARYGDDDPSHGGS
ncbi:MULTISPECIES: hypothetical protein [Bradyrhizobium]|uniref:hypothetical protein n=1 Tax=Bradyrhizobium TaxID=374 RepID=UPI0005706BCA|nr:hypothetical protein [Bradyrhizobium elkanii]WLA81141.1 hypothetical protein QNJ99_38140 [Bradyrhizobium elkanii]